MQQRPGQRASGSEAQGLTERHNRHTGGVMRGRVWCVERIDSAARPAHGGSVCRRPHWPCRCAQGWDKTYCLRFVEEFDEVHFFGDKTYEVRLRAPGYGWGKRRLVTAVWLGGPERQGIEAAWSRGQGGSDGWERSGRDDLALLGGALLGV